jgi:putative solute:sodium symporter small subunit
MAEATRTGLSDAGEPPPGGGPPDQNGWRKEYWRRNLRLMVVLLTIWFVVSFGCGILFVEQLNKIVINGFPLGFWFAQQGSIYTFILLILVYALRMDRLDDEYGVSERDGEGRRM